MLNRPIPAVFFTEWANGIASQSTWRGKIVILDFWATWCDPCLQSIAHNNEMFHKYKDKGVILVGACGSGQDEMTDAAEMYKPEYPIAKVSDNDVQSWNIHFWPHYAIIDRHGILRAIGIQPTYVEPIVDLLLQE